MTVMVDHRLPLGVATPRSFRMRAISLDDLSASSSNNGASAFARSIAAALAGLPWCACLNRTGDAVTYGKGGLLQ
jgi:hypothetical protein